MQPKIKLRDSKGRLLRSHQRRMARVSSRSKYLLVKVIPVAVFVLALLAIFPLLPFAAFAAAALTVIISLILAYGALNLAKGISCNYIARASHTTEAYDQVDIEKSGVGIHFRYVAALLGFSILFALLIIFSPVVAAFSVPMIALVSLFSAFTFLNTFYKSELSRDVRTSTASMISKRVLINLIMFGLLVAVFFPILSPFVFVACMLGALALSRILCEPLLLASDREDMRAKGSFMAFLSHLWLAIKGPGLMIYKMLWSAGLFFIPMLALAFFLPPLAFGITLGLPIVLAGSAIAALFLGRIFFHSLISSNVYFEDMYNHDRKGWRNVFVAAGIFLGLSLASIFAIFMLTSVPVTLPLVFVITAGASIVAISARGLLDHKHLRNKGDNDCHLPLIQHDMNCTHCLECSVGGYTSYVWDKATEVITTPFPEVGRMARGIYSFFGNRLYSAIGYHHKDETHVADVKACDHDL